MCGSSTGFLCSLICQPLCNSILTIAATKSSSKIVYVIPLCCTFSRLLYSKSFYILSLCHIFVNQIVNLYQKKKACWDYDLGSNKVLFQFSENWHLNNSESFNSWLWYNARFRFSLISHSNILSDQCTDSLCLFA